jgi:hypothetical protein
MIRVQPGAVVEDLAAANLKHAASFLKGAYSIVLALALSEAFKQFEADSGERNIFWDRTASLIGFLMQIFPFFHGMSRYLFKTYLSPNAAPGNWPAYLMFDGIMFMLMSGCFFVMSRSLSTDRWKRFYGSASLLLIFDSTWIGVGIWRGVKQIEMWLYLNGALVLGMLIAFFIWRKTEKSLGPPIAYAAVNGATTVASYYLMRNFYFSL